ncbi:MAG: DUF393 domain-containing protein [Pseudomonadota bacterium]
MIQVYYDGKCGLCSKEINHYRKIAPAGVFDWKDVTQPQYAAELKEEGISLSDGLRSLHAKDVTNTLHRGVDAFILIWNNLGRWKILGFIVSLPIIKQCARLIYRKFANWRFARLEHCQLAADSENLSEKS